MHPAQRRLLQRLVVSLALGLACGWILLAVVTRIDAPPPERDAARAPEHAPAKLAPAEHDPAHAPTSPERVDLAGPADAAPAPSANRPPAAPTDATLIARLVDAHDGAESTPLPRAPYLLVPHDRAGAPLALERWKSGRADDEGRLVLTHLQPGAWTACFTPLARVGVRYALDLPAGTTDLGDVVFQAPRETFSLEVRLQGPGFDLGTSGTLHLWSRDDGAVDRWMHIGSSPWMSASEALNSRRVIEPLPRGRYALAFLREDRAAEPEFREVDVPSETVVFELGAGGAPLRVVLESDAGAPPKFATLVVLTDRHAAPFLATVADDGKVVGPDPGPRWRWVLLAAGCAPLLGTREDFRAEGGELVLHAASTPGHGVLVVARDAEALLDRARADELDLALGRLPALEGIELSVRGRVVARTDADGLATCALDADDVLELGAAGRARVELQNLVDGRVVNEAQPVLARFAPAR